MPLGIPVCRIMFHGVPAINAGDHQSTLPGPGHHCGDHPVICSAYLHYRACFPGQDSDPTSVPAGDWIADSQRPCSMPACMFRFCLPRVYVFRAPPVLLYEEYVRPEFERFSKFASDPDRLMVRTMVPFLVSEGLIRYVM